MAIATFEPIATYSVGNTGITYVEFTGISATYTDLRLMVFMRQGDGGAGTSSAGSQLIVNGNTGSNYGTSYAGANPTGQYTGASANTQAYYGETSQDGNTSGVFSSSIVDIPSYSTTTGWKQITGQSWSPNNPYNGSSQGGYMFFNANVYRSTVAITAVRIYGGSVSLATELEIGCKVTLFGIKAA